MTWDAAKGKATRRVYDLDVFQSLTTPYRVMRAARLGGWAAAMLAVTNVLTAARVYFEKIRINSWVAQGPVEVAVVCAAVAALAACLSVAILKRQPVWASITILVWTILETQGWLTLRLYGHVSIRYLPAFALIFAVMGVRGALALRKLESAPSDGAASPPSQALP